MIPTPFTVTVAPFDSDATDAHGNDVDAWGTPVDQPVYGWGPAGSAEPREPGRDEVTTDLDLLVPPGFTCTPRDRVTVADQTFEVEGRVQDYTRGPFGYQPGGVVRLQRVEG